MKSVAFAVVVFCLFCYFAFLIKMCFVGRSREEQNERKKKEGQKVRITCLDIEPRTTSPKYESHGCKPQRLGDYDGISAIL